MKTDETSLTIYYPSSHDRGVHFQDPRTVNLSKIKLWSCSSLTQGFNRLLRTQQLRMSEVQNLESSQPEPYYQRLSKTRNC